MLRSQTIDKGSAMVLAPMIGVIEPCILAQADSNAPSLNAMTTACTAPQGSAAALVESTLKGVENGQATRYPLGYTLPVPLLQLFRQDASGNWVIDDTTVGRLVRTVRDSPRPVVLYLFSTHFASGAPLERVLAQDPANLMHTRDGPMPEGVYGEAPIHHWTLARTDTPLTQRRIQAAQALMDALCQLPAVDIVKIKAVTLLGELHHFFPDFEAGMGFDGSYRITDYSAASVQGFRDFLRQEFGQVEKLNRLVGADYAGFDAVQPPSRDIRTEPLQRFQDHIDAYAHGSLPVTGWAYTGPGHDDTPRWVHVYRNGVWAGKAPVNQGRQDVLQAKPELGHANTGWRFDLDFKHLPSGMHRLDVFLETRPGQMSAIGTRHIAVMDSKQSPPPTFAQQALPASTPLPQGMQAYLEMPREAASYYYNPLVPLWHAFRAQQVVTYLQSFNGALQPACLAKTPRYMHQIMPLTNPSWDENKFAAQASLRPLPGLHLGVSLYGDATYGQRFDRWYARSGHTGYGVTEFHPLKPMDATQVRNMLQTHAQRGAQFLSFFMEPRWQGQLVERGHNILSIDPSNALHGSDVLYRSMQEALPIAPTAQR
jgi:hypothetical protein